MIALRAARWSIRGRPPAARAAAWRKWPKTGYRRQMVKRFRKKPRGSRHRRGHGQRWPMESGFSWNKRRRGAALRARRWPNQKREILTRVLTHNLVLLATA
jgi:transposase